MSVAAPPVLDLDDFDDFDDFASEASEGGTQWFGVPATLAIVAPTRAAADELAATIAKERLSRMLDFGIKRVRVAGRQPPATGASATWLIEALFAVDAHDADEARCEVERVCRLDAAESHLFLGFGRAQEIEDEHRLNAMCRRLLVDTVGVLTDYLRGDLADIASGTQFDDTLMICEVLPPCFRAAYDLPLLERFVDTVESVGVDLLRYPETYFASTAEELAAHAIIGEARAMLDHLGETPEGEVARQQLAEKLEDLDGSAFEDHDILMAWSHDMTDYMTSVEDFAPENWFKPFRGPSDD